MKMFKEASCSAVLRRPAGAASGVEEEDVNPEVKWICFWYGACSHSGSGHLVGQDHWVPLADEEPLLELDV